MRTCRFLFLLLLVTACAATASAEDQFLNTGWRIQSSVQTNASGEEISSPTFDVSRWYAAQVPCTVLSALVQNGVYRDIYFGRNLETISTEPFLASWWYRTVFDLKAPAGSTGVVRLLFDGINYSANVFLNGKKVRPADEVFGAFRRFDVDVSQLVRSKGNVLAVEVFPPKPGDFTIGFVDWNPGPPDRNMGLWRPVRLRVSGPVSIENPYVQSKVDLESLQEARLTIQGKLVNHSTRAASGKLRGKIQEGVRFEMDYALGPGEEKEFRFSSDTTPALILKNPRLWWPNNLGSPELYQLELTASAPAGVSDSQSVTFGIREVSDYINEAGHRGYKVNGRKVLIRGGGWVDDALMHEDEWNLDAQFRYIKHLNLNAIRLEGFWGSSERLYELADRYGILILAGFSCQWEWEHYLGKPVDEEFGGIRTEADMQLAAQYLRDQVLWLRNHPSILAWLLQSDLLPRPELEKRYREDLSRIDPDRPILASAKGLESTVSGPTAVKMNGPYEYEPPVYWYTDTENGGAFGFNTETGPGAQPPPAESIRRMFSKDHYWPIDDVWNFHSGRNEFNTLNMYLDAFNKRYGEAESMEDFTRRAQAANYEAIRAMFEAFGVRKPVATGVVQWMLNASWPKMFWQLYDYYLMPGGAFYGARKANQPLNIAYDYSDRSIHVINDTYETRPGLSAEVKLLSLDSKELLSQSADASVNAYESREILKLPEPAESSPVYFLSLKLKSRDGEIANNFYWLSSKPDVLDSEKTDWYYTPMREHADLTSLNKLPEAEIRVDSHPLQNGMRVVLKNSSPHIAFFIELRVAGDRTGRTVLPVFWEDNYVSLLPGETREISVSYSQQDLRGEKPVLLVSGWNVKGSE